jgi:hypothetical protein
MPTTYPIPNGRKVFDATLYTGDGTTGRLITNNDTSTNGFQPDLVWIKSRSNALNNNLYDSNRGAPLELASNLTTAETSGDLSAFNTNGFTVNQTASYEINHSGYTYVGWNWQAGQGTTSSNTNGTITSTVSVNQTSGFSIVTWTGNGVSSATVGHGLGVQPAMVIAKCRSTTNDWWVTHQGIPNSYIYLESTGAAATGGGLNGAMNYQSTYTNSVFGFLAGSSTVNNVNQSGGTYVAYCWAPVAGFSQFGSYTGNGSADGPFVYLGFRPKYILIKRTDSSPYNWIAMDTAMNPYNAATTYLEPNQSDAQYTDTPIDFLSNGFKLRYGSGTWVNASGGTYIYAAWAENPFKYSLAR